MTGVTVTAEFAAGKVTGNSGCNRYGGSYRVDGDKLTIGPEIASTLMACVAGPTAVEQAYLARLPRVTSYAIRGTTLTLVGSGDKTLLVYEAIDGAKAVAGEWNVVSYYSVNAVESTIAGVRAHREVRGRARRSGVRRLRGTRRSATRS